MILKPRIPFRYGSLEECLNRDGFVFRNVGHDLKLAEQYVGKTLPDGCDNIFDSPFVIYHRRGVFDLVFLFLPLATVPLSQLSVWIDINPSLIRVTDYIVDQSLNSQSLTPTEEM